MIVWALGAIVVARRVVVRAHRTEPGDLGRPYGHTEIALLTQTTTRAILASIGALRDAGAIDAEVGHFFAIGRLPPGMSPVDQAVYWAVTDRPTWREVEQNPDTAAAVEVVEDELRAAGALMKAPIPRFRRRTILWTLAVIAAGTVGLTIAAGAPFFVGLFAGLGLMIPAGPFLALGIGYVAMDLRLSRAGNRVLRRAAPSDLGRAVALAGVGEMWQADPVFAARAGLPESDPDIDTADTGDPFD
jgi:uncharacterized protein (TIGR04222 family)